MADVPLIGQNQNLVNPNQHKCCEVKKWSLTCNRDLALGLPPLWFTHFFLSSGIVYGLFVPPISPIFRSCLNLLKYP
jgi:hypothetical protein